MKLHVAVILHIKITRARQLIKAGQQWNFRTELHSPGGQIDDVSGFREEVALGRQLRKT